MTTTTRPTWLDVEPDQIPARLRAIPRWVCWRAEFINAKWTKVPYQAAAPAAKAATNDPATWATFDAAVTTYFRAADLDGLGYVLDWDDPIVGIDLDHCRHRESGVITVWARAIIERLQTYTEISPSGTGLRLFAFGALTDGGRVRGKIGLREDGKIEFYDDGRYLTVTGHHLAGTPTRLENRLDALAAWHAELFPAAPATTGPPRRPTAAPPTADDAALLDQARGAANGEKFRAPLRPRRRDGVRVTLRGRSRPLRHPRLLDAAGRRPHGSPVSRLGIAARQVGRAPRDTDLRREDHRRRAQEVP